ncbi:cytochrome bc complex cytochrome b subunit [Streptomyces sp. NPDC057238]|uniref:cytochrome b n=1 Tax=Streptomyces sp. NPDC057238 TaxID=3346060 RepID=UPI00363BA25C
MPLSRGQGRLDTRAARSAERTTEYLDRRLPLLDAARTTLRKAFPDHWSFLLGELALYSFVVLLVTGVWLTLFFEPSMSEVVYQGSYVPLRGVRMSEAFASTLHISFDVRGGLLIRQIHHWAALVMAAAVGVHLLRVFFTGAFRRPREANWLIGLTLFLLTMLEGFAGYSLPDDLLSGTGLRTAQGFVLSVPVVGTYLSMFLFGGEFPGHDIVSRLYPVHILLLPGALLAGVVLHLILGQMSERMGAHVRPEGRIEVVGWFGSRAEPGTAATSSASCGPDARGGARLVRPCGCPWSSLSSPLGRSTPGWCARTGSGGSGRTRRHLQQPPVSRGAVFGGSRGPQRCPGRPADVLGHARRSGSCQELSRQMARLRAAAYSTHSA